MTDQPRKTLSLIDTINGRPLREHFNGKQPGVMGDFQMVDKDILHVDHTYQRRNVSQARINRIAREWNWIAFLVLAVFRRADGSLWIYDGQHRHAASLKRDDIRLLPCVIFPADMPDHVAAEAEGFVVINTARGGMPTLEKFRADLVAKNPIAVQAEEIASASDYRFMSGNNRGTVSCVEAVQRAIRSSPETAARVFAFCASLARGESFTQKLFDAVIYLDAHLIRHGLSLDTGHVREKLHSVDMATLIRTIEDAERFMGKGGFKVGAVGLVSFINKGKRSRHIPSIGDQ